MRRSASSLPGETACGQKESGWLRTRRGRFDGGLQIHSEDRGVEEDLQHRLLLDVAPGVPNA